MKKIFLILFIGSFTLVSCKKFLDINSDPDTPQNPDPTSVFPTMLANIPGGGGNRGTGGVQSDALWIGSYIQFWHSRINTTAVGQYEWDIHGFNSHTGDRAAGIWRLLYFGVGKSLPYCETEGAKHGQWDVVGATQALRAYLFQLTTNYHGEIIYNDAFKEDSIFFRWDDQSVIYRGVDSICRVAIDNLNRTDYDQASLRLSRGDIVHSGNIDRWKKFTYGILARNFAALINKPSYSADSVIKYCNLSLASGADDFLIPFDASRNEDANWFGTFRNNIPDLRQSDYIVRLLDGRVFTGGQLPANRDPRIRHMLSVTTVAQSASSGNGGYNGVVPNVTAIAANGVVNAYPNLWGDSLYSNPSSASFSAFVGKYLFQNKAVMPVMTFSEIQFMKAEAALRKNDPATAYTAYIAGINGHFDFINRTSYPRGNSPLYNTIPITAAERASYLLSGNVKQTAATLRLEDIMQQKFIAMWGWGWVETWTDMRKYHYTDIDPLTTRQVYSGMVMPTTIFSSNGGITKYAYRVRPRYNSEYVWNIYMPAVANQANYHTLECWFSKP